MQDRLKPTTLRYSWVCFKQSLISIRGIYIYCISISYFNLLLHTVKYKTVGRNLMFQSEHWNYNFQIEYKYILEGKHMYMGCAWCFTGTRNEIIEKLLSENYSSILKELSPWWFVGRFWWIPSAWPSSWGRTRSSRLASRLRGCYSSVSVIFLSRIIEHMPCFTIE